MGSVARGQNASKSPANTISNTTAAKEPTPIPLAEVVLQSSSVSENLREIEENLSAHRLSATVDQQVAVLTNDIDAGLSENLRILTANPFLYELGHLETGWHYFGDRLSFWNRLLTVQATELDSVVAHLDQLGKTWEQTLKLAHSSGAPPAVLQRAQDVIATINQTHKEAEKQLMQVLILQSRVAEQDRRVSAARASVEQARRGIVDHLLVQDSPPIWSVAVSSSEGKNLVGASYNSFRRQLTALRAYAKRHTVAFVVHALTIVLLLGILYWARPRVKRWIQGGAELRARRTGLQRPDRNSRRVFISSRSLDLSASTAAVGSRVGSRLANRNDNRSPGTHRAASVPDSQCAAGALPPRTAAGGCGVTPTVVAIIVSRRNACRHFLSRLAHQVCTIVKRAGGPEGSLVESD